ncbi:MAG: LysE family transporter [Verrucomicrobia bacterium]|nr:LysE family transporter [Verrucomicrobiota bacterium]
MSAFFQGLLIGFSIAVPVGPIGLLCLRRSLTDGRLAGLVSGLGAATADALYGVVAALGLTAVTGFLLAYRTPLQLGGGLFLLYLGLSICRAQPPSAEVRAPVTNLASAYGSTLLLTLANPTTILSFLGIFASLGVVSSEGGHLPAFLLVLWVFIGSAVWWVVLSLTAGALGPRLQNGGHRLLNLSSGLLIAAIGVWQLVRLM